jgi:hypothetical protein
VETETPGDRHFHIDFQPFQPFQVRVSNAFHPISSAEKSPRPLIFSHLPLFAISFLGKCLNTNTAFQQNAIWVELAMAHGPILHEDGALHKRNSSDFPAPWKFPGKYSRGERNMVREI